MTPAECTRLADDIAASRGPEWSRHLDLDDIGTMLVEMRVEARIVGPDHSRRLSEMVRAWQVTAGVWADIGDDAEARRALLGPHDPDDFLEMDRP